jgi:hypothetical protein
MRWEEREHPRHPAHTPESRGGEFREKSDWATARAERLIPSYRPRSERPDLEQAFKQNIHEQTVASYAKRPIDRTPDEVEADYRRTQEFFDLRSQLHGAGYTEADVGRLHADAQHEYYMADFVRRELPDLTRAEAEVELARRAREAFSVESGRKIAIRVTPASLDRILDSGRIYSAFEGARSRGLNDLEVRARHERIIFGLDPAADAATRPVYGYLDPLTAPAAGRNQEGLDESLYQYGRIRVVLRDSVRPRTTAMFGDSLDLRHAGLPAPIDDPDWRAYTPANPGGLLTNLLSKLERDPESEDARMTYGYIEAQVHGGVTLGDIEEVVFPSTPPKALREKLEQAGIPWRVIK